MPGRLARSRRLWICFAILITIAVTSPLWLGYAGTVLEDSDPPRKADAALVLAGDYYGDRIRVAAELARRGLVPKVYVSGPELYGLHEDDLAIQFAVRAGYPVSYFVPFSHEATSTKEEAASIVPRLRAAGIRNLIIVTSDYHTRRARRIFRQAAPDMAITMVAAPDSLFVLRDWWRTREGRKTVYFEWTKTVTERFGL